jgi:hypothetical protein
VGPSGQREREEGAARANERGEWAALGQEQRAERGPESAQPRRGRSFPFYFYFLFTFSLIPFLLYTNIHLCFLGAKMKYYM